jgi:hypothetical protein
MDGGETMAQRNSAELLWDPTSVSLLTRTVVLAATSIISWTAKIQGHQWQLWWAGNWLGSLCLVPVALTWWIRFRIPALSVRHNSPMEVVLIGGSLLVATVWVFMTPPVGLSTLLKLPSTILALLVVAAFRLPPRCAPPDVRRLMSEASHIASEIHAATQRVIADLSPPGLYELGLEPALKWLAVQMRSKYLLQVDVQVQVDDSSFDLNLRVLVYKLIRELLRNVVKHAHVQSAEVIVNQSGEELHIEVIDKGVGFEWQMDLFETRLRGFGLWSIADRVRETRGELTMLLSLVCR